MQSHFPNIRIFIFKLMTLICVILGYGLVSNVSVAQTRIVPNASKNGICVIFYVEMEAIDDYTKSENKFFKRVASRFAETRKGRCYAMNNEDLIVNEINVFKTGENFLNTLRKISREMGPISELYIFAHGVPLGIVGSLEDSLGIQKMCVNHKCLSPTDFAFAIKNYLTRDANVVLHSCSVSVTPSDGYFKDQEFDKTPVNTQSADVYFENVTATGTIIYAMNITLETDDIIHYDGYNATGNLVVTGMGRVGDKTYPLQKLIQIQERIGLDDVKAKRQHLSIPILPDWFTDRTAISADALKGATIELDLTLEPDTSFAESLTRELARIDSASQVAVWGHINYTKAGYNCGWVKHTVDHPEATSVSASGNATDKMPLKLQCGAHKTCDGNSDIVKVKECYE